MKVVKPSNTEHVININPRFYPSGNITMDLTQDGYNTTTTLFPTYDIVHGVMTVTFELEGEEGDKFAIKLTQSQNVFYRGVLFFTDQDTQDYKQNKGIYIDV